VRASLSLSASISQAPQQRSPLGFFARKLGHGMVSYAASSSPCQVCLVLTLSAFSVDWRNGIVGMLGLACMAALLYRFLRPDVKDWFPYPETVGRTPSLGIRMVAVYHLLTVGFQLSELINPTPSAIFGVEPRGNSSVLYALAMTAVNVYVGIGLYAMKRSACWIGVASIVWNVAVTIHWAALSPVSTNSQDVALLYRLAGFTALLVAGFSLWQLWAARNHFS
jgi:hypothetical protein